MSKAYFLPLPFLIGLVFVHCSMSRFAANQTVSVMVQAMPAYERETNLELAEQAIASNLKLLEGLLEVTPDNTELLLLASRGFTSYAFGFIEEKIDIADQGNDFEEKAKFVEQAVDFYVRARDFAIRAAAQYRKDFPDALEQDVARLASELKRFKKEYVPALFWTAFAWGNIIYLQQDQPVRLAEIPKVDIIMRRVLELDENYYFGGAHMFYGVFYGSRPTMLGGDPVKAKEHFQRAIEISQGKYLMSKLLLAKYYAVTVQDKPLFEETLQDIISAPKDLFPEQGLANQLAKRNAERLLAQKDNLFL